MLGTITLTVGQPDGVAQKEEAPETMDTIQGEVAPQVNGEKVEKESPDANDISAVEEKAAEEKPDEASEVGFKKIFRFVGFKFTLKKDKSEEKDPVKLLTVKDKEGEEVSGTDEPTKEEEAATAEENGTTEEKEADTEASTPEAEVIKDEAEITDAPAEGTAAETTDEAVKDEGAEKEETTLSPFRKLFSGGLFSNLRKKASIKKPKEEEDKEAAVEEEAAKTEETAAVEEKEEKDEVEQETKEEAPATPEEVKSETAPEPEVTVEPSDATDETKPEEEKAEPSAEEEKAPAEVTSEAELLSSQEKAKPQGSPLKKLFTGAGLKKLSTKKQKNKKDAEAKAAEAKAAEAKAAEAKTAEANTAEANTAEAKTAESGEQAAEQLQSSTESAEAPKADSGPSSPEESGEHVIAVEVTQNESSQETDGEVASDGEKKKEGIIAWSSFKKLVTPKRRVKRSSESEDEATAEKQAKSATLSSSESAPLADKSVEEEAKEDKPTEEEPKTENTEKLVSSTEEPKKKMDTSVSWEALMCMGGPKKRTRKTSDSDDEETKVEEESVAAVVEGEQEEKTEAALVTSQNTESDGEVVSSPEPAERESTWDTLKRMVMPKNKAKAEEKPEEMAEQVQSDGEAPKDESSFSLRKLFPGRRKKKADKQASTEQSEDDSDTPAVVPLSEYEDRVEAVEAVAAVEAEQEAPAEPAEAQVKVSAEDRSPSWIPATVEDGDDKPDQLSDIPEEAENAATPKSVDTDIAEDEDKDILLTRAPGHTGRRLSTAEVMPVAQAPSAETTPVPQGPKPESAEEVMESIEAQISAIPPQTDVAVEAVPVEVLSEKTEYEPPTEQAESKTNSILEPHAREEAMAICTGLGTKEIAKVALEKPAMPIIESMAVIRDGVSTEVSVEDKPANAEEAIAAENEVLMSQVHQVETMELEPVVESSQSDLSNVQAASEGHEPAIENVGLVSAVLEESEIIQSTTMSENSVRTVDPIAPTSETAVCTQSVEVTELIVETKEVKMDLEQLAATEENTIKEVAQYATAEIASTISATTKTTITEETEPTIPVVEPTEGVFIAQAVVLVAPAAPVTMENASEPVGDESIEVQETKEEVAVEETVEATTAQTAESEISEVTEEISEKTEEVKEDVQPTSEVTKETSEKTEEVKEDVQPTSEVTEETSEKTEEVKEDVQPTSEVTEETSEKTEEVKEDVQQTSEVTEETSEKTEEIKEDVQPTSEIEAQSMVIAQAVIQEAMDKVSEDVPESKTPTDPTPVQAEATTENEITTETPVIFDTPVAVVCEKPAPKSPQVLHVAIEVTETIPVEVTKSLDASVEEVEEKKPEEGLKKAVEVNVSEETVVVEEVVEIKAESGRCEEQVKEEQSKEVAEVQEADVKEEAAEEVEPEPEEAKSEQNKEKVLEVHMPVQVVLQTAQVFEEPSVEEEAAVEFDSNGPVTEDAGVKAKSAASESKLPTLSEEPQATASAEVPASSQVTEPETQETPSGKCAEVMAQVIEVIEEAVKEIEPVSTEITAAS
ncbi:A-kinase anchor protein 12b isoform X2 [Sebastes umbrosus]|uniref:A-kinase anchor protein 12b isoform X2 n=1 Tax=Sebastes umbrosus TaxID=72105 RepID=UPI00189F418D|nr:A-kinase anchor protein 12b isoform X2 [Sebastes umbrosus]